VRNRHRAKRAGCAASDSVLSYYYLTAPEIESADSFSYPSWTVGKLSHTDPEFASKGMPIDGIREIREYSNGKGIIRFYGTFLKCQAC